MLLESPFSLYILKCSKCLHQSRDFVMGEQLHCLVFKGGCSLEIYVCNALVTLYAQSCAFGYSDDISIGNALASLYARCCRIQEAYLAFEKIEAKDNISWNGLISKFTHSGYCEEALQVFTQMNKVGVHANLFTFGSAASAAANLTNIKQGKQIHAMIVKTGCNSEIEVSNVLITLYSKCKNINDAKREFLEMAEKNEVSWNAMITGYSQHGCGFEALHLFKQMKQLGMMPTYVTFVGVLTACSHVGLVNEGLDFFESD